MPHSTTQIDIPLSGKHVALVANTTWCIHQYRNGVLRQLVREGVRVSIIAPEDETVALVKEMGCEFHALHMDAKGSNPLSEWDCFRQLLKLYAELRPDHIFHYTIKPNIYGAMAARRLQIPSTGVITGLGFAFLNNNLSARVARGLLRVALRCPDEVWFLNADDAREFQTRKLVNVDRSVLLPGEGVNTDFYSSQPYSKAGKDGRFRFLLIGRMLWDKGVAEYVEAARQIRKTAPHISFQLLGPADVLNPSAISRSEMAQWEKEGVIEYLGSTSDVRPAIDAADCIVLPSYREGMSRTLMEAAAMGKPIVASDVPGCRDIVRDGVTGKLCQPRSAESLRDAMLAVSVLPLDTRCQMGRTAREDVIRRFSEERVVDFYLRTLNRAAIIPCGGSRTALRE